MADDAYGAPEDVQSLMGRTLTAQETATAAYLLAQVAREFRSRVVNLDARVASGEINSASVAFAAAQVVRRVLMNPNAIAQESVTTGPFTKSATRDKSVASGLLYVGHSDIAHFLPAVAGMKVGTLRVAPGLA